MACTSIRWCEPIKVGGLSAVSGAARRAAPLVTAGVTIGLLGGHARLGRSPASGAYRCGDVRDDRGTPRGRAALGWSVLTGLCTAATVVDAIGVRSAPSANSYIVWVFIQMGAVVVAMFGILSRGTMFAAARAQWRPGVIAGAEDPDLWPGADRLFDGPDCAARSVARDRDGDGPGDLDPCPEGTRATAGRGDRGAWMTRRCAGSCQQRRGTTTATSWRTYSRGCASLQRPSQLGQCRVEHAPHVQGSSRGRSDPTCIEEQKKRVEPTPSLTGGSFGPAGQPVGERLGRHAAGVAVPHGMALVDRPSPGPRIDDQQAGARLPYDRRCRNAPGYRGCLSNQPTSTTATSYLAAMNF